MFCTTFLSHSSQNIKCLATFHHGRLTHPEIWLDRSGGKVGTLDAGMSIDVSSSGRPRECSDSMQGRLEVDAGRAGCLVAHVILILCHCHLSPFWSVGPPPLPSPPLPRHCCHHHLYLPTKSKIQRFTHIPTIPSLSSPLSLYTINVHGSGCQGIVTYMSPVESFATGIKIFDCLIFLRSNCSHAFLIL